MNNFINKKLKKANCFINETIGLKTYYNKSDIFIIFTKFGWVEELTLDEVSDYIPTLGHNLDSISSFTKGFINSYKSVIYAIRMQKHFNLFVIGFNNLNQYDSYFSVTINDETLEICYILEEMLKQN